ncbi:MAG: hypothetical protein HYR96_13865 [Deltaproteobacteria bacterium]|nr:hypothetical protein [Deltaproteobacteria bacterium]MBI3296106.1 hypothetical protein [Deltaproteobacteria bacterium]
MAHAYDKEGKEQYFGRKDGDALKSIAEAEGLQDMADRLILDEGLRDRSDSLYSTELVTRFSDLPAKHEKAYIKDGIYHVGSGGSYFNHALGTGSWFTLSHRVPGAEKIEAELKVENFKAANLEAVDTAVRKAIEESKNELAFEGIKEARSARENLRKQLEEMRKDYWKWERAVPYFGSDDTKIDAKDTFINDSFSKYLEVPEFTDLVENHYERSRRAITELNAITKELPAHLSLCESSLKAPRESVLAIPHRTFGQKHLDNVIPELETAHDTIHKSATRFHDTIKGHPSDQATKRP